MLLRRTNAGELPPLATTANGIINNIQNRLGAAKRHAEVKAGEILAVGTAAISNPLCFCVK